MYIDNSWNEIKISFYFTHENSQILICNIIFITVNKRITLLCWKKYHFTQVHWEPFQNLCSLLRQGVEIWNEIKISFYFTHEYSQILICNIIFISVNKRITFLCWKKYHFRQVHWGTIPKFMFFASTRGWNMELPSFSPKSGIGSMVTFSGQFCMKYPPVIKVKKKPHMLWKHPAS